MIPAGLGKVAPTVTLESVSTCTDRNCAICSVEVAACNSSNDGVIRFAQQILGQHGKVETTYLKTSFQVLLHVVVTKM